MHYANSSVGSPIASAVSLPLVQIHSAALQVMSVNWHTLFTQQPELNALATHWLEAGRACTILQQAYHYLHHTNSSAGSVIARAAFSSTGVGPSGRFPKYMQVGWRIASTAVGSHLPGYSLDECLRSIWRLKPCLSANTAVQTLHGYGLSPV